MAIVELTAAENLLLLREIDANRAFMLLAYQSNPALLKIADEQIKRLFENDLESAEQLGERDVDLPAMTRGPM
jgi:hypothetical protein